MRLHTLSSALVVMGLGLVSALALRAADFPAVEGKKLAANDAETGPAGPLDTGPVKVEIRSSNGEFRLYRGGQPYFIRGAGFWGDPTGKFSLKEIAARSGNSVRSGGNVLTEWGPSGDWQVTRTKWGASIEETSSEKADRFAERYRGAILKDAGHCLGSYAFLWQWRQERTHTWYGLFLESGERTEAVNALEYLWSRRWPANRTPRVEPPRIDGQTASDNVYLQPGSTHTATIKAEDPEGDPLDFAWEIMPEVARGGYAGMGERRSQPMPELIVKPAAATLLFAAPPAEGAYRVFVFVRDGQGNAATANIPFYVKP